MKILYFFRSLPWSYEVGSTYTYSYSVDTVTSMKGTSDQVNKHGYIITNVQHLLKNVKSYFRLNRLKHSFSTSSLTIPSFQGDPTIFCGGFSSEKLISKIDVL